MQLVKKHEKQKLHLNNLCSGLFMSKISENAKKKKNVNLTLTKLAVFFYHIEAKSEYFASQFVKSLVTGRIPI